MGFDILSLGVGSATVTCYELFVDFPVYFCFLYVYKILVNNSVVYLVHND